VIPRACIALVAAACLALPAAASAAYGPHGAVYAGTMRTNAGSQRSHPLTLELTANGKVIKGFVTYWRSLPCSGTATDFTGGVTISRNDLGRDGRFSDVVSLVEANPDDASQKLSHRIQIRGKAGRRSASGTYHDVITITDASGAPVSTCDTGTMRWSVRRGKGRYAGTTAQNLPVTVNRSGKRATFFVQSKADCGGGTVLDRTFKHSGIRPGRGGRFGKSGGFSFTTEKGAQVTGTYSLSGRFSGRRASGRYTLKASGTTAAGQKFDCALNQLRYSTSRR